MGTRGRWVIGGAVLVLVAACAFYIIDLLGREWVWRFTAEAGTCCTPKGAGQQSCREAIQKLKWAAWTFGDTARAADEKRRACEQMIASPPPPRRSDVAILAEHLDEDAGHPYDLGGPCTSGQGDSSDLYQAHTAALIDSNWPRVVELDRQILRNKCADNGRWATLADHLLYLGKLGEVMQILTELHRRGFEFGAPRQKYKRALKGFLSSAAFKLTRLGKALEEEAASGSRQKRELLKKLLAEEKSPVPPDPFVSKDSCPHECCQFGEWTAKKDVTLFDAAKGSRPVGAVRAGEKIEALEGDAYIRPVAAVVVRDYEKFRKDDLLFILDSFGEGQVSYWYHGHVGAKTISTAELKCVSDRDGCWSEYLDDGHSEWWVKMQLPDGGVGWTAQTDEDVFSGQRSQECGGE